MIIVDIPTVEERGGRDWYETIPLSIIITQSAIITVCMQDTPVLHPFMEGTIRGFNTYMKTRFILQILYRNATMYLRYLRIIDRESDKLELKLRHSMQNREILMLLELSKTLVYFTTSLKSNEIVMEKLTTLPRLKQYPEDEDLLDDVITENKQAIEMANIYSGVLANMTDAFASIVSNNLNNVMRIFTIISITLSIPTLIFSMYGMNFQEGMLGMPLTDKPWGFAVIIGISGPFGDRHLVPHPVAHVQVTSMMGKARYVAAAACAALLAAGAGACGTSVSVVAEGAAQGPTIAVGVAADQPGLGYLHGGEYSGFDIDVAKYVAKTLGYAEKQIVFKQLSPAMRASALTDGTVDMVVDSFSMDGTHDGEADVAGPYLTVREALLIRSDSASEITGTDSLSDKNRMRGRWKRGGRQHPQPHEKHPHDGGGTRHVSAMHDGADDRRGRRRRRRRRDLGRTGVEQHRPSEDRRRSRHHLVLRHRRQIRTGRAGRANRRRIARHGQGRLVAEGRGRHGQVDRIHARRVHESAEGNGQGPVLRRVRGIGKITAAHVPE